MNHNLAVIWQQVLSEIEKKLSKPSFETWLKSTKPVSLYNQTIMIEVPNDFTKDWLESRYKDLIIDIIRKITANSEYQVNFVISQALDMAVTEAELPSLQQSGIWHDDSSNRYQKVLYQNFNPRYTFESFVVGNCNRLAHAASLAAAEAPAKAYNPLFIYGGVGLGKTHLMQAIGHYSLNTLNLNKICYISSEKFTNEFINSIRDNKTVDFRNRYRNVNVLLIDDIQFLAGKEQTQEEFFHTFNTLYENYKQIVVSSDRPPKEIPTLEDRLRSRFEWGLITDIQSPDLETRIAILRKKARSEKLDIPNDVILYIADKIETNIRELEGALIRIVAYASLSSYPITLKVAEEALKNILLSPKKNISISRIINKTANHFGVLPSELKAKKRNQNVTLPRHIAMYLAREITEYSLPKIGEEFGGRDHTTVIHACKKIEHELSNNKEMKHRIDLIKNELFGS